jgi:hypothetical protein
MVLDSFERMVWESEGGAGGVEFLELVEDGENVVSIQTDVPAFSTFRYYAEGLIPGEVYMASVYVRGEDIALGEGREGDRPAVIYPGYVATSIEGLFGTFGWRRIETYFKADENGEKHVLLSLGYGSTLCTGKVWYKDLLIEQMGGVNQYTSGHVRLTFPDEDLMTDGEMIYEPEEIQSFTDDVNKIYDAYLDLTGYTPFDGAVIDCIAGNHYGAAMYAGNPIEMLGSGKDVLRGMPAVNFGLAHELGHDFDYEAWNFHGEMWANFKIAYAAEEYGVAIDGYDDGDFHELYMAHFKESFDNNFGDYNTGTCTFNHDGLMYHLLKIKDDIGWEPYKQTFRWFQEQDRAALPRDGAGIFELFISKLSQYSGKSIKWKYFPTPIWRACVDTNLQDGYTITIPDYDPTVIYSNTVTVHIEEPEESIDDPPPPPPLEDDSEYEEPIGPPPPPPIEDDPEYEEPEVVWSADMKLDTFDQLIWRNDGGGTVVFNEEAEGHGSGPSVSIENPASAYTQLRVQVTGLEPNEIYIASVYVKGEDITLVQSESDTGNKAAYLSFGLISTSEESLTGTFGWRKVSLIFKSFDNGERPLCLNLGSDRSPCTGKVWFDDLEVRPIAAENQYAAEHVRLSFMDSDLKTDGKLDYDPALIQGLVDDANLVYEYMEEFLGYAPYDGAQIDGVSGNYYQ